MMDDQPPVLLPVLNSLTLISHGSTTSLFKLKTPRLETYGEDTDSLECPIHTDVSTIMQMRFVVEGSPFLSLSFCHGLKRLQIYTGDDDIINSVFDQLLMDGRICPALQVIELLEEDINADIAPHLERLPEINRGRAHAINMVVLTDWTELPGSSLISVGLFISVLGRLLTNSLVW